MQSNKIHMPPKKLEKIYIHMYICTLYRIMMYSINKQENVLNPAWSNNGKLWFSKYSDYR